MKTILHKSDTRGSADHGWLKAKHSFSFANYYNPERVHFGILRVLNDDIVAPDMGFGMHPHDNMEIITIPLKGSLQHRDSMGNTAVITHGEVQVMSAGTGITHSEFNPSKTEEVNLLQIWVFPEKRNITPRYDQKLFSKDERKNKFQLVVSPGNENGSLMVHQQTWFSLISLENNKSIEYTVRKKGNGVYAFVIEGEVTIAGIDLLKRDGLEITDADKFSITAKSNAEILLMDLPMN
ncbi:MAG: pirin family protein [Bacteroidia bacterium]